LGTTQLSQSSINFLLSKPISKTHNNKRKEQKQQQEDHENQKKYGIATKWHSYSPDIIKIANQVQKSQNTKSTRPTIDTTTQSPWFPRKARLDPSLIFHGNLSCHETPWLMLSLTHNN